MDTDNAIAGLKKVRDEIAACLGIDDSPTGGAAWCYEQQKGPYEVMVTIESWRKS